MESEEIEEGTLASAICSTRAGSEAVPKVEHDDERIESGPHTTDFQRSRWNIVLQQSGYMRYVPKVPPAELLPSQKL